ncbi:uncharacterized protein AKAW2_30011A [Aspergillus luchuensis]|uniref:DUF221 membrane protein n=1 Tax=Aspergillus kawachii TaxID=1069201 RepID=A0A146F759_ASPKA|nr:uncharacterized protein AKAW2_30011A [Aspergillus luchuensis]BCR96692.1 hypothetical protein AKAW2_30011A [Aspergillus luchuensis]BCS09194.1 hypothetical protein ALUC_30011A [Aspergillus luchuensis]GAA92939.1 hypothetical protein AKAW_11052 [Aspergillus luchuensis IFO 4308]GAT21868.1 DUF221 membrane protein [Aspergillus luchuensis]
MSSNRYPTRSSRRLQCQKALTDHIYQRLSKRIDPKHVRLQPRPDDPYRWVVPETLRATFKKNLSRCAVELLPAIEEALKNGSVQAVEPHTLPSHESPVGISAPKPRESDVYVLIDNGANGGAVRDESSTATIRKLEQENEALRSERQRINESHARELLEERGHRDAERRALQEENERLKLSCASLQAGICHALDQVGQIQGLLSKSAGIL